MSEKMYIERDVGGVEGLYVCHNAIDRATEKRLFDLYPSMFVGDGRSFTPFDTIGPSDRLMLTNIVTSALPDLNIVVPNQTTFINYTPKGVFQYHFDSRVDWGEAIIGYSLGAAAEIRFKKVKTKAEKGNAAVIVKKILPRRSFYVMTGESRWNWKHGVYQVSKEDTLYPGIPDSARRSITFRSTMDHNLTCLHNMLATARPAEQPRLAARIKYCTLLSKGKTAQASAIYHSEIRTGPPVVIPAQSPPAAAGKGKGKGKKRKAVDSDNDDSDDDDQDAEIVTKKAKKSKASTVEKKTSPTKAKSPQKPKPKAKAAKGKEGAESGVKKAAASKARDVVDLTDD